MKLSKTPKKTIWKPCHYVFVEKVGPFAETAQACWQELHKSLAKEKLGDLVTGYASIYKIRPKMIYRAGVVVSEKPKKLSKKLSYELFDGGDYLKFVLRGSYMQLPEACGQVFEYVETQDIKVRKGYYIENYVNDPKVTPEAELITEIMVPV